MAAPKIARITRTTEIQSGYHELECEPLEPFSYKAGQYVIMHSDLPHPTKENDVLKKAFSFSSAPGQTLSFTVAKVGPMSEFLASRKVGDEIRFSGPWGKVFFLDPEQSGPLHLFATGSGFSPIGAIADAAAAKPGHDPISLRWSIDEPYHEERLERWAQSERFSVEVSAAPSVLPVDPEARYFLAGDGARIVPQLEALAAGGVPAERVRVEYFFNKPS